MKPLLAVLRQHCDALTTPLIQCPSDDGERLTRLKAQYEGAQKLLRDFEFYVTSTLAEQEAKQG